MYKLEIIMLTFVLGLEQIWNENISNASVILIGDSGGFNLLDVPDLKKRDTWSKK